MTPCIISFHFQLSGEPFVDVFTKQEVIQQTHQQQSSHGRGRDVICFTSTSG